MDRPQVVLYRMNPVSHWVARAVLKKGQQIALPNLLADARVPEFLQHLSEEQLLDALLESESSAAQETGRVRVREAVRGGGFELAAERVLFWLSHPTTG